MSETAPTRGGGETSFRTDIQEEELSLPRRKPKSILISLAYRGCRIARRLFGPKRLLGFLLDVSWLSRLLAFEVSGKLIGESFHCGRLAITGDFLRRWVPEGGSLVDVGCGNGRWCYLASQHAGQVVGVDYNRARLDEARRFHQADNVRYVLGDVKRELSEVLDGRRFDVALVSHVLEHIDSPDGFLASLEQITSLAIIEVPDFEADMLNHVRRELGRPLHADGDHVREYTADILRKQLARNGWQLRHLATERGSILAVVKKEPVTAPPAGP